MEVYERFEDALDGLEGFSHIFVIGYFHQLRPEQVGPLRVKPRGLLKQGLSLEELPTRGVFALDSPTRPNPMGLSLVRLVRVEGRSLYVAGLDLFDGTPVLDIKPYQPQYRAEDLQPTRVVHPAAREGGPRLGGLLAMPSAGRDAHPASDSGLYQLVIGLSEPRGIIVGRHGRFSFPAGYYVYTGSARRGLESRIARHLRSRKTMRWHIDYLLRSGQVLEVRRYATDRSECELSGTVEALPGSEVIAPGFGSSDCRCSTHLFHFLRNPAQELG